MGPFPNAEVWVWPGPGPPLNGGHPQLIGAFCAHAIHPRAVRLLLTLPGGESATGWQPFRVFHLSQVP